MPRLPDKKLEKFIEWEIYQDLLRGVKNINSIESLDNFFNKFITKTEKSIFFRRIAAMKLIKLGRKYREIKDILDTSNDTISRATGMLRGIGYNKNPDNKRKYSAPIYVKNKKRRHYGLKYKGSSGISGMIDDISDIFQ